MTDRVPDPEVPEPHTPSAQEASDAVSEDGYDAEDHQDEYETVEYDDSTEHTSGIYRDAGYEDDEYIVDAEVEQAVESGAPEGVDSVEDVSEFEQVDEAPEELGAPSYPVVWRPVWARRVCFTLAVVVGLGAVALSFISTLVLFDRVGFWLLGGLISWFLWRQGSVSATATEEGVSVRNLFNTQHVAWAEIVGIADGPDLPWARIDLASGDVLPVMALQTTDGEYAVAGAQEMRDHLDWHAPADPPYPVDEA